MFDVLVYLFENYLHATACPDGEQLTRKLTAAGFEQDEIEEALEWLNGLQETCATAPEMDAPSDRSVRIYAAEEQYCLSPECLGFLSFLEATQTVDPLSRELIIERALAISDTRITLQRFKVIVLMVLWQQEQPLDSLLLDELLYSGEDEEYGPPLLH